MLLTTKRGCHSGPLGEKPFGKIFEKNGRTRIMRSDIVPGGVFPDYELPDHTGTLRKLSDLQGEDPLILTLARCHYCSKEHQEHRELAAFYPKIGVACTQIVNIAEQ